MSNKTPVLNVSIFLFIDRMIALLYYLRKHRVRLSLKSDRLGRSMSHLIKLIEALCQDGISFKLICDGTIDTTTASGELIFDIFSSLAQFERRFLQRQGLEEN